MCTLSGVQRSRTLGVNASPTGTKTFPKLSLKNDTGEDGLGGGVDLINWISVSSLVISVIKDVWLHTRCRVDAFASWERFQDVAIINRVSRTGQEYGSLTRVHLPTFYETQRNSLLGGRCHKGQKIRDYRIRDICLLRNADVRHRIHP